MNVLQMNEWSIREGVTLVDAYLVGKVLLVGQPVEEQFDQPGDVRVAEEGHLLQLELLPVLRNVLHHEDVDDVHQFAHLLLLHSCLLPRPLLRRAGLRLRLLLFLLVFAVVPGLLVDGLGEHHEEHE
jgi:hypothetical protein